VKEEKRETKKGKRNEDGWIDTLGEVIFRPPWMEATGSCGVIVAESGSLLRSSMRRGS
jgi:hypothetical protein